MSALHDHVDAMLKVTRRINALDKAYGCAGRSHHLRHALMPPHVQAIRKQLLDERDLLARYAPKGH
jgi:hypothetical protein